MTRQLTFLLFIFGGSLLSVFAQERLTEHTFKLGSGMQSPSAKISDMEWFAGHWTGEDSDGLSEEIWSPPRNGMMMGMYRLIQEEKPIFYEFMTLAENKGSLVLQLKHFNGDMVGWEEKNKTVDFPFVMKSKNAIHFKGIAFYPNGKNAVTIYLAMEQKDGSFQEGVFNYKRVFEKQ